MPDLWKFPKLEGEERKQALSDPGPSWREYFYRDFLKVWICLGFFIVDVLIAAYWIQPFDPALLLLSLVPVVYLEFLAYQYLWHSGERRARSTGPFRPTWRVPVEFGRWTEQGERIRRGLPPFEGPATARGPDPGEFL